MKVYRVFWVIFGSVLGVFGAVLAFTWSVANVVMLVCLAALLGAAGAMVAMADSARPARPPREGRRMIARSTALAAAGMLSFIGHAVLVGVPTALLLAAIVVAGSPYAIRRGVRWLTDNGHLAPVPPRPKRAIREIHQLRQDPVPKASIRPDALSDEALCLAWRASFLALQKARSPMERMRIVDERQAFLDEIERRTRHGMAAWLASKPRAAGDPTRFVLGDGAAGRAGIDWDDLLHETDS